jgi:fumarate hydratase subunit beta
MTSNTIELQTPLSENEIRSLKVGDVVFILGTLFVVPSVKAHKRLLEYAKRKEKVPMNLYNGIIYHCPCLLKKIDERIYKIITVGATTSIRFEPLMPDIIRFYRIKAIIGKGGMGSETLRAMKEYGCVYLSFIAGCSPLYKEYVRDVVNIYWEDIGIYDAIIELKVDKFGPLLVTMDSHGNDLYKSLEDQAKKYINSYLQNLL